MKKDNEYDIASQQLANWVIKYTCLIININPKTSKKEAIATGTLVRYKGRNLIISAGHTFTQGNFNDLYVYTDEGSVKLSGMLYTSWLFVEKGSLTKDLDYGYIILDDFTYERLLKKYEFLPETHLKVNHHPEKLQNYVAFGFPYRKTKIEQKRHGDIYASSLFIHTVDPGDYRYKNGFNKNEHIVVAYNKLRIISTQLKGTAPNLQGMSGGGLWLLTKDEHFSTGIRLVGILIEFDTESIYATKIDNIVKHLH